MNTKTTYFVMLTLALSSLSFGFGGHGDAFIGTAEAQIGDSSLVGLVEENCPPPPASTSDEDIALYVAGIRQSPCIEGGGQILDAPCEADLEGEAPVCVGQEFNFDILNDASSPPQTVTDVLDNITDLVTFVSGSPDGDYVDECDAQQTGDNAYIDAFCDVAGSDGGEPAECDEGQIGVAEADACIDDPTDPTPGPEPCPEGQIGDAGLDTCVDDPTDPTPGPEPCPEGQIGDAGLGTCVDDPTSSDGIETPVPQGPFSEIASMFFPDEGNGEGSVHVVLPPAGSPWLILAYSDLDGDGYTDFEELTGCGDAGVSTNPMNDQAHCDNYDGDVVDNDVDPRPTQADNFLVLTTETTEYAQAPVMGDEIHFSYQCFDPTNSTTSLDDLHLEFAPFVASNGAVNQYASDNRGGLPTADFIISEDSDHNDGAADCHTKGTISIDPTFELNATNPFALKGNHGDAVFTVQLVDSSGNIASNPVDITVSNQAEDGSWRMVCTLNQTSNGYCGTPGEYHEFHGVNVTYDADRFPDIHPHPNVDVTYNVTWIFNHTSYLTGDGHNITQISLEHYESDGNCGSNTNSRITFGEPSQQCGFTPYRTADVQSYDAPNGTDSAGNPFYFVNTTYTVRAGLSGNPPVPNTGLPGEPAGDHGLNLHMVAEVIDRGGTATYWGERTSSNSDPAFDDHGKFTDGFARYTRVNQAPQFDYVATGKGPNPSLPHHDNETTPYVVHDREAETVTLSVILHDDRGYADAGSPGDDLNVSISYAIVDNMTWLPPASQYTNVSDLPTASNACSEGPLSIFFGSCKYEGDGDSGGNTDDGIDDRVDGTTANSEAFEAVISVPDGKVLRYSFRVNDSYGVEVDEGTEYTYIVGELPKDAAGTSALAGSTLDNLIQTVVDSLQLTPDVIGTLTDEECGSDLSCESGAPADESDPWDVDEDGNTSEPNGQPDIIERRAIYIDTDAGSDRKESLFDDFDGYDGADGASVHIAPTDFDGVTEVDHPVIRVGDVNGTDDFELIVIDDGFGDSLCIIEHPGQADVSAYLGGSFADSGCGDELTYLGSDAPNLKAVAIGNGGYNGYIIYDDVDNDDERDGAEGRRSNMVAGSCEDVLIVAIDEGSPDASIVRLLAAEPYSKDPCANTNLDHDGDGVNDDKDSDDDNDGIPDEDDSCPTGNGDWVPDATNDTDGDGCEDAGEDLDDDNDGTPDDEDAFPNDPDEDKDTDGDGIGDNEDTDDDNDGTPDDEDAFPKDPAEDSDKDGDGKGDNADSAPEEDLDGDGVPNALEGGPESAGPLCVTDLPIGWVGICYNSYEDAHRVRLGPMVGPALPF